MTVLARPKKPPTGPRLKYAKDLGALHRLLLKCCPPVRRDKVTGLLLPDPNGVQSISHLAELRGISAYAIYKWIEQGKIPPLQASEIVDMSEGRATLADFSPFVYI